MGRQNTEWTELYDRRKRSESHTYSQYTVSALEQDRARIGAELHDGLGQNLVAVKLGLEPLLEDAALDDCPELKRRLQYALRGLETSIDETRRISVNLKPPVLNELGLFKALSWFVRQLQNATLTTEIHLQVSGYEHLISDELQLCIYRVAQEACNNALKYAGASHLYLQLFIDDERCKLQISDDGDGFSYSERAFAGIGLGCMRERVESNSGKFALHSKPGSGTYIEAEWLLNIS